MGGDKTWQHDAIWDILFLAARGVALLVEREPKHLLLRRGQKHADHLIWNFLEGFHALTFDVSTFDTLQSTSLDHTTVDTGYVAQAAHDRKTRKFQDACLEANFDFPLRFGSPLVGQQTRSTLWWNLGLTRRRTIVASRAL